MGLVRRRRHRRDDRIPSALRHHGRVGHPGPRERRPRGARRGDRGAARHDAARAARQVPGAGLGDRTVVWGHSQGGHAALWAGQLADAYAPDLAVAGTAALSPASDPLALAEGVLARPGSPGASLAMSFVVDAYTRYYPELEVDDVVAPSARTIVREAASRCTDQGGTLVTILAGLAIGKDQPIVDAGALDVLEDGSQLSERLETWTRERSAGEDGTDTCGGS